MHLPPQIIRFQRIGLFKSVWFMALLIYLILFYLYQIGGLLDPMLIADDVRCHVYGFYRYLGTNIFQDDLLTDYRIVALPLGYFALYYILAHLVDPLILAKCIQVLLHLTAIFYLVKIGTRLRHQILGFAIAILYLHTPYFYFTLAGGLPRSFSHTLLIVFLYYLISRREIPILITVVLSALFYPHTFLLTGTTYGLWLIGQLVQRTFSKNEGFKRSVRFLIILLLCFLVLLPLLKKSPEIGNIIPKEIAENHPEYSIHGGRMRIYPLLNPWYEMWIYLSFPFEAVSDPKAYKLMAWNRDHHNPAFMLLAACIAMLALVNRRKISPTIFTLLPVALFLYLLARQVGLLLYYPDRFLAYSLPVLSLIAIPAILASVSFPKVEVDKSLHGSIVLTLLIIFTFIFYGPSLYQNVGITVNAHNDEKLILAAQQSPADSLFAGFPYAMDNISTFSQRRVYLSFEGSEPLYDNYHAEIKRRTLRLFSAYYAYDWQTLLDFLAQEKITHLVINKGTTADNLAGNFYYYEPYTTSLKNHLAPRWSRCLVVNHIPPETILTEDNVLLVINAQKLAQILDQERPEPFCELPNPDVITLQD